MTKEGNKRGWGTARVGFKYFSVNCSSIQYVIICFLTPYGNLKTSLVIGGLFFAKTLYIKCNKTFNKIGMKSTLVDS